MSSRDLTFIHSVVILLQHFLAVNSLYTSKHDQVAEKLANRFHTEYMPNKGIDIVTSKRVIEIEVKKAGLDQGLNQIIRSSKPRYLAVSKQLEKLALDKTRNTGVGVTSETGRIVKRASR